MLSFIEAQKLINDLAHSFGTEEVGLDDALSRVLAEDIYADRDYPPFNRSAMDGYAIRKQDMDDGIINFKLIDTIYAGASTDKILSEGECYKIMTGAAVPLSSDLVIRIEDSEDKDGHISFRAKNTRQFQNIARKGEDLKFRSIALKASLKINASIIGVLASLGRQSVLVQKLPSIGIVTTGDEVVEGAIVNDVQIRNSNLPVLKALVKKFNLIPSYFAHAPDNISDLKAAFNKALAYDIVIVSGGVSAGDADHVPHVLHNLGVEKLFHKVSIRPGKPLWCGYKGEKIVFALPGNPFSCIVTFKLFVETYINACLGISPHHVSFPLKDDRQQRVQLDEFFPVKFAGDPTQLIPLTLNGSGDIRLAYEADALALHGANKSKLVAGEAVSAIML